jgi:hypothetical protein
MHKAGQIAALRASLDCISYKDCSPIHSIVDTLTAPTFVDMAGSPTEKSFDGSTLGSRENTGRDKGKDLELGLTEDKPGTRPCS